MPKWYYMSGGERNGPLETDELQGLLETGGMLASDYVWRSGMGKEWLKASEVPELASPESVLEPPPSPESDPVPIDAPAQESGLKLAKKEEAPAGAQNAMATATTIASAHAPLQKKGKGYYCPHCDRKLFKNKSVWAQRLGGLIGMLLVFAFQSYQCPSCGKIKRSAFPFGTQVKMLIGTVLLLGGALALIILVLLLIAWGET